ncbi:MAG: GNAT family N-acetyltransferase [Candidatus Freyarchaeota archaeon]
MKGGLVAEAGSEFVVVSGAFCGVIVVLRPREASVFFFPLLEAEPDPARFSRGFELFVSKAEEKARRLGLDLIYFPLDTHHSVYRRILERLGFTVTSSMMKMVFDLSSGEIWHPPPEGYSFRNYMDSDMDGWIKCVSLCFGGKPGSVAAKFEKYWLKDKEFDPSLHFVAQNDKGEIVGVVSGWCYPAAGEGFIKLLGVHPLHRRRGIAKHLLSLTSKQFKERGMERISLDVSAGNIEAISLYKKLGFKESGLIMRKMIKPFPRNK